MNFRKVLITTTAVVGVISIAYNGAQSLVFTEDDYTNLLMQNIEALTEGADPHSSYPPCPAGFIPNRYIVASVTVHNSSSDRDGSLNLGESVSGEYKHNTSTPIVIETKNCDGIQEGACCDPKDVGTRIVR